MSLPHFEQVLDQVIRDTADQGWSYSTQVLDPSMLAKMNAYIESHRGNFKQARIGKGSQSIHRTDIRGDRILWLDSLEPPEELKEIFQFLSELQLHLNRNLILGLKDFECHLAYYPPGTFYKTHVDRFTHDSTRTVSFVFYVHQSWNPGDGGELIFHGKAGGTLKTLQPLPGSLVVFLSDLPHEVKTTAIERRSFTGWFHTQILT